MIIITSILILKQETIGEGPSRGKLYHSYPGQNAEFQMDVPQRPIQSSQQDIEIPPSKVNEVPTVVNLILEPETREKEEAGQPKVPFKGSRQKVNKEVERPFLEGHKGRALPSRNLDSPLDSLLSLLYPLVCCFVSVLKSFLKRVTWRSLIRPVNPSGTRAPGFYFFCSLSLSGRLQQSSTQGIASIEVADCLTLGTWSTG